MSNPILVEVTRGGIVESLHRGAIAVAGPNGRIRLAIGDVGRAVFPRSAVKLIQALPLIETGAADAFGFGTQELALAGSSHSGEALHVAIAARMLERAGLDAGHLECGIHPPMDAGALAALHRADVAPTALHNNCSGKHAGMLATARHLGEPTAGYVRSDHPVQGRVARLMAELTGLPIGEAPCGIDGCSVPTWALPLSALASAFARLASGAGIAPPHAAAARRLIDAAMAEPHLVAGTGRFCTRLMQALPARLFAKTGAEGVYCAVLLPDGVAVALKIDDGAGRAAETALAATLLALAPAAAEAALQPFAESVIRNHRGIETGGIRPSAELRRALGRLGTGR